MVDITIKTFSKEAIGEMNYKEVNKDIRQVDFELVTDEGLRIVMIDSNHKDIMATEIDPQQTIKMAKMILSYYKMY